MTAVIAPHYGDETVTLYRGHAPAVLGALDPGSVSCVVTSPPYFGLRSYLPDDHPDKAAEIGAERTPVEYVEALRAVFREVYRVLADDGTFWLNIGDSYATKQRGSDAGWDKSRLNNPARVQKAQRAAMRGRVFDRPHKSLLMIPARVALALQDDGWILRNEVVWHKPNGMPESVNDRFSARHETLFLFVKARHYWFDLEPVRVPTTGLRPGNSRRAIEAYGRATGTASGARRWGGNPSSTLAEVRATRNPGDVWSIPTSPFTGAHFAAFPPEIPRRCIASGCRPGGVVLDPFHGSGTTGMVAQQLGHPYIGIDVSGEYLDMSLATRLSNAALPNEATS